MQIVHPSSVASNAFAIGEGKQLTLSATGLVGTDQVFIDILELSEAPNFSGNPCCDLGPVNIQILRRTPLRCPDGRPVRLTAEFPTGAISAPQGVPLGARVVASPESFVSVSAAESASSGCGGCLCDYSYCPSVRISCDGQPGFGFHEMDPPDPAATVVMGPCDGDTSVDPIRIYPAAGPGHTVKVSDCDGVLIGYAANRSDCAPDCGCPKDPVINVTLPSPNLVALSVSGEGEITATSSDGSVVKGQIPTC